MDVALYLVATPIGHLDDITFRALNTLKAVDLIACEDTRRTQTLLRHFGFHKPLYRYDEHTHEKGVHKILGELNAGHAVALVTDAGTPGVSDPGARLVHEVIKAGKKVVPIPGPSSVTAALSASGFSGDGFVFLGFLPRREGRARALLQEALGLGKTVLFFESPFRIKATLERLASIAPHAPVIIGRELTKIHEEFIRGEAQSLKDEIAKKEPRGEYVVMISPETNPPLAEEEGDVRFDSR